MRVYVPLTLPGLAAAHRTGTLGAERLAVYAVTPALRAWCLTDDLEELEYAALNRAALASLRLLAADPGAPRRRVVVAVDVPDDAVSADADREGDPAALGEVWTAGPVALAKAAAVHVDADEAEADVAAAAGALATADAEDAADPGDSRNAADAGEDDAQALVDATDDHELLWFATQEVPNLVGDGGRS
ncbi:hypothetical protein [Streptomyces sp. NPDC046985]|uniref:DUF6912 family protein n=1 Tax=Streptomyces sp. NPDC046985 TaxID=3155377 RepID=UPI0033FAAF87